MLRLRSVPQSLARAVRIGRAGRLKRLLLMPAASEFLQRMIGMRKSITLSKRLIRLANDAELGILCGIVCLTKDILRKIVHAGAIIALLTGAASAQMPMPGINLSPDRQMTPEEKEKQKAIENAYKSAIEKIPDKKAPADPWGAVRSTTPSSKPKQGQQ
jgi:hypothetical protein